MQKELKDEEFIEYIIMTMSREMFPKGRRNEVGISGISFNYAFIGAAKGRQRKGCSKHIEQISPLNSRLYWNARSQKIKVVGLIHEDNCGAWVMPEKWVIPDESNKEVVIAAPVYDETRCKELAGRLDMHCMKYDVDYKSLISFLGSLRGTRGQVLEESNELCMKCLLLFYPSLIKEFCNGLMHWCDGKVMNEHEYAQISICLNMFLNYLKLLDGLKALGKGNLFPREIINVLNQHQLQILSFKMEQELRDDVAKGEFTSCLQKNVRRGILNVYCVEDLEFEIDSKVKGVEGLKKALWEVKKLAAYIVK